MPDPIKDLKRKVVNESEKKDIFKFVLLKKIELS
jgi:hypothetical protein